jgi:hypothetical protein
MLEFERNSPIETTILAEFFARCGWEEFEAGTKLEWVLAASEEWVTCRLDGELIGFGRSCRLGPVQRVVCDVLVDTRFQGNGLRREIVRLLSENVGSLEEVSVFTERQAHPLGSLPASERELTSGHLPDAPPGAYLGRNRTSRASFTEAPE